MTELVTTYEDKTAFLAFVAKISNTMLYMTMYVLCFAGEVCVGTSRSALSSRTNGEFLGYTRGILWSPRRVSVSLRSVGSALEERRLLRSTGNAFVESRSLRFNRTLRSSRTLDRRIRRRHSQLGFSPEKPRLNLNGQHMNQVIYHVRIQFFAVCRCLRTVRQIQALN